MTPIAEPRADSPFAIVTAIWVGVVSVYTTVILPLILSGAAATFDIAPAAAGIVASAEMGGIAIGTLIASLVVAKYNRRGMVAAGAICATVANLVSTIPLSFEPILVLRVFSGMGSGVLLATMAAALAATRNPDRYFGLFVAGAFVSAAISFGTLSALSARDGVVPLFAILAALNVTALLVCRWFPVGRGSPETDLAATEIVNAKRLPIAAALAGIVAFYLGVGGVWPMMGAIGSSFGIGISEVGRILAGTSIAALCGALTASFVAARFGRTPPLVLGLGVAGLSLIWLAVAGSDAFRIAPILFLASWNFSVPYMMGQLSVLDPSGRAVAFNMTLQYIGFAVGPILAGWEADSVGLSAVIWAGAAGCLISLSCFLISSIGWPNRRSAQNLGKL
jgi:MFS transporter, DHA1 family, inner membrane transport protein